jgi:hypothetical protein
LRENLDFVVLLMETNTSFYTFLGIVAKTLIDLSNCNWNSTMTALEGGLVAGEYGVGWDLVGSLIAYLVYTF